MGPISGILMTPWMVAERSMCRCQMEARERRLAQLAAEDAAAAAAAQEAPTDTAAMPDVDMAQADAAAPGTPCLWLQC